MILRDRSALVKAFILTLSKDLQQYIMQDLPRWQEIVQKSVSEEDSFIFFWDTRQEFRSLIKYRMKMAQTKFYPDVNLVNELSRIAGNGPSVFVTNLFISCNEIDAGFYIEHGFSTIVFAKTIGKNFWLNQNVTIGTGKNGYPSIGDNVRIGANSVVIGSMHINNNVKLGAGCTLNFEVPAGSTVVMQKPRVLLSE